MTDFDFDLYINFSLILISRNLKSLFISDFKWTKIKETF